MWSSIVQIRRVDRDPRELVSPRMWERCLLIVDFGKSRQDKVEMSFGDS